MSVSKRLLVGAFCLVAGGSAALAQTPQEEAALRQSCSGDYMRHCSMFNPNSPQVEQCFQAKMAQLTPQCRGAIAAYSKTNPDGRTSPDGRKR